MQLRWFQAGILALALTLGTGRAWPAETNFVTLNFVNADIEGVVRAVSEITGKNFVIDPRVKGVVNIVSAKPISRSLVYDIFLSALRLQGFAAIDERGIVRIVPESEARLQATTTLGPGDRPSARGDQVQTQVFTLQHESAAQLVPILRPLITPNNTITAYPGNNTLVVTDYASNLVRIRRIIESIDQPGGSDPIMIPLRYASALDVAQTVSRLFAEVPAAQAADPSQRLTITADPRSNSLLARSDSPARLTRLRGLVAMLDSPASPGGNIHVIHLKNAEAAKIAETLRAIYLGETTSAAAPRAPGPPAPLGAQGVTTGPGTAAQPPQAGGARGIIQADVATNSIIINAPDALYNNLRSVVEKLDVRRAQVYVEALIAELTADRAAEFGIQWQDLTGAARTSTSVVGGTNFGTPGQNVLNISQNPLDAGRGLNIGIVRGVVNIGGAQLLNLGLLVRALESTNNANILSTPTLLTLDNEEAKIVIGQNVPFITGQYAVSGAATTPTPFQTIERKDVGLTLRIRPQISEGGAVRLQIFQEVSSIQDRSNVAGVITNKRSVESTVLVDDGQIVVIGGLMQDSLSDGLEKVPGLGDLPLIGNLFRYNTRTRSKTNLMVFLRPTLVRDSQRADAFTTQRYEHILGEQQRTRPAPGALLPDMDSPTLPPRTGSPVPAPVAAALPAVENDVSPFPDVEFTD